MLLTKDEIAEIIEFSVGEDDLAAVEVAAEAIAAQLTPAHLMSYFVTPTGHKCFSVPDEGQFYTVCLDTRSPDCDGFVLHPIFCGGSAWRDDCKTGECIHVQAVKLYLAREETT